MQTLTLDGIDGQHLWGFLTALGSLSLLDGHARAETLEIPRLAFEEDGTAVVHSPVVKDQLAAVLLARLRKLQSYLEQDLATVKKPSDFTRSSYESIALASSPGALDFLAGLACVVGDEACESTLCAANGASHQNLVQSMRDVLKLVEDEHVRLALFETWQKTYRVPDDKRQQFQLGTRKPTLRLDPSDERLYALRLSNPTTTDDFRTNSVRKRCHSSVRPVAGRASQATGPGHCCFDAASTAGHFLVAALECPCDASHCTRASLGRSWTLPRSARARGFHGLQC